MKPKRVKKKPGEIAPSRGEVRLSLGRPREEARFTAAPPAGDLPRNYGRTLAALKELLQRARLKTVLAANAAMIMAYWKMGRTILERQAESGWGAKVIDRLSADLRREFPDMRGLSPRNLLFMRAFAEAYPDARIVKQVVSPLPWGHIVHLLQRVKSPKARLWYARNAVAEWKTALVTTLPEELQGSLPTVEQIERELSAATAPHPASNKRGRP